MCAARDKRRLMVMSRFALGSRRDGILNDQRSSRTKRRAQPTHAVDVNVRTAPRTAVAGAVANRNADRAIQYDEMIVARLCTPAWREKSS